MLFLHGFYFRSCLSHGSSMQYMIVEDARVILKNVSIFGNKKGNEFNSGRKHLSTYVQKPKKTLIDQVRKPRKALSKSGSQEIPAKDFSLQLATRPIKD